MPLTPKDGALLGAGMTLVAATFVFYKQKKTAPFRAAYFLSWPVLGSAIILAWQPSNSEMEHIVKGSGRVTEEQLKEGRSNAQLQLDSLRNAAKQGKLSGNWLPEEPK